MATRKRAPRRTRAESDQARSARTRERLLRATCESLVARGYSGTTTVEICRRAKLERGTMLHHFPERAALMVAAVEYVFEERLAETERRLAALPADARGNLGAVLDLLFDPPDGHRTTLAWLELLVASRTDPELHRALTRMMRAFDVRVSAALARWLPAGAAGGAAPDELALKFAFALSNGLVLDHIAGYEHGPAVAAAFKALARALAPHGFDPERLR